MFSLRIRISNNYIFSGLVVLLPLLYQISSPIRVISLGEFILLPFVVGFLISDLLAGIFVPVKGIVAFYFVPILCTLIICPFVDFFRWSDAITVIARIAFYFTLITISLNHFQIERVLRLYYTICVLAALYLFLQVVGYYFFDILFPIPRNNAKFLFAYDESINTARYYRLYGFRPASLFTEPSFYANYFVTLIAVLLFSNNRFSFLSHMTLKSRIIKAAIFSMSIILTTSTLGVVFCFIIWSFFFLANYKNTQISIKTRIIIGVFIAVVIGGGLLTNIFSFVIKRTSNGASIGERVLRGIFIYNSLPIINKIVGIGLNNIENYVNAYNIRTIYDGADLNFTVTSTNRLISSGAVGFSALLYFVMSQFKRCYTVVEKTLMVVIFVQFIFDPGEYSYIFAFMFVMLYGIRQVMNNGGETSCESR